MTIRFTRRHLLLRSAPAAAAVLALPGLSAAQAVPETARILCGYPAGGSVDVVCRKLADKLAGRLARHVVVENRVGAAGRLAVESLKSAPADGAAILVTPASVLTMYPHIYRSLSYDVFRDLAPVSMVAASGFALAAGTAVPAQVRTLGELLSWLRDNPAAANCGNAGAGSFPHFMAMLLAREAKVELTHVPYQGGLPAMRAAAAGQVPIALGTEASALALVQAGKLRVLATTGSERSPFLPEASTFRELGYPVLAQREWFAAFMAGGTPPSRIATAAEGIGLAMREPEVRELCQRIALSAESSTPAELQRALRAEHDFWGPIVRASGFTPDS